MGIDWYVCENCNKSCTGHNYYCVCDLCYEKTGCIQCGVKGIHDFIMNKEEYVLCISCMFKGSNKLLKKELKERYKPRLAKGETTKEIDSLELRRKIRKKTKAEYINE